MSIYLELFMPRGYWIVYICLNLNFLCSLSFFAHSYDIKYFYLIQIIWEQIHFNRVELGVNGIEWVTIDSLEFQKWSLTTRCSLVSYSGHPLLRLWVLTSWQGVQSAYIKLTKIETVLVKWIIFLISEFNPMDCEPKYPFQMEKSSNEQMLC